MLTRGNSIAKRSYLLCWDVFLGSLGKASSS
jgi:hypothetical protein